MQYKVYGMHYIMLYHDVAACCACFFSTCMDGGLLPCIPPANHEGLSPSNFPEARDSDLKGHLELAQTCFRLPYDSGLQGVADHPPLSLTSVDMHVPQLVFFRKVV